MDDLDLARWTSSGEPALVLHDRALSFGEVASLGARELVTRDGASPLVFVARPDAPTLCLALAAISRGIPMAPLHPKLGDDARAALERRVVELRGAVPASTLAILATSGSTGVPKLVVLGRAAMIASAKASRANIPLGPGDRWLLAMPFAHAGGLSILTRCLEAGATIVVANGEDRAATDASSTAAPRPFDPRAILDVVDRRRVTLISVVPTMLASLLEADHRGVLAELRAVLVGGAACPPKLLDLAWARGVPALATYGLTETASQIATQPLARAELRTNLDSGLPLSGATIDLVDDRGAVLARGQGRIRVRGPMLMTGYLGEPRLDGPLVTADIGSIDELGRLHVHGRADDVIVTGGENVHPLEVETALLAIEGVRGALVAGVPDERWGQIVGALVVLDPAVDEARIHDEMRRRLPAHQRPRVVVPVDVLPLGATGKPDRVAARALVARSPRSY